MRSLLSIVVLAIGLVGPCMTTPAAEDSATVDLAAPRLPSSGEALEVQVTTGPLPAGARVAVSTENGETLGAVAPFGPRATQEGTTATVAVPRSALSEGHLRLRLQVIEPSAQPRAPQPGEVKRVVLVVVPQSE